MQLTYELRQFGAGGYVLNHHHICPGEPIIIRKVMMNRDIKKEHLQ